MADSKIIEYGISQGIDLEDALRRAQVHRSAAVRNGLRRLWTAGPFSRAAARSIR